MAESGYQCAVAATIVAAWERISTDRPDLVVLDVMDPQQDALALIRKLKADPSTSDIPVVMMSPEAKQQTFRNWR